MSLRRNLKKRTDLTRETKRNKIENERKSLLKYKGTFKKHQVMAKTTTQHCFSNGTEFMVWQSHNCEQCVKSVWYNEKTDTYPKYRCAIQGQLEGQLAGLYEISERTYNATQQKDCPYKKTERTKRPKKDNDPKLFNI